MLTDATKAKEDVIVYDGTGRHEAVSTALHLAEMGRSVQFVCIDDNIAAEMAYSDRVVYRKRFNLNGVKILRDNAIRSVRRQGNGLVATFRSDLTGVETELSAAQVIVEYGTAPVDEVFNALRERSANRGITDIEALMKAQPQPCDRRQQLRPASHRRRGDQPQRLQRDLRRLPSRNRDLIGAVARNAISSSRPDDGRL